MKKRVLLKWAALCAVSFLPRPLMAKEGNMKTVIDRTAIAGLVMLLGSGDSTLLDEVLLAVDNPEKYFARFEDDLAERWIEEPERVSFWLALVDGLQRRGYLWEVDWKNQGSNLAFVLERLSSQYEVELDFSSLAAQGDEYHPTIHYAESIVSLLSPKGLTLVWLDIESDCYPWCVVSSVHVSEIQNLARRLSQRILVFDRNSGDI